MTKKIDVSQLIDIARNNNIKNTEHLVDEVVEAVESLSIAIADFHGINHVGTYSDPVDLGGLLSTFGPAREGQQCPRDIDDADPTGDWD